MGKNKTIDRFRYIKIQPKTIDLGTRLWGISTEFVGFIPQSLVLRSIVLNFNISKLAYCVCRYVYSIPVSYVKE